MTMGVPNPVDNEDLYNAIVYGGVRSPGVVTITGHDRKVKWDIKSGPGMKGATMTKSTEEPVQFTCSFYLADKDDFDAWDAFKALVDSTVNGKTPKALDIYHPDLAEQGIKSAVKDTTAGTLHDGKGGQTKVVKFIEYFPPKPSGGTAAGAKAKASADPNQAKLDELKALTNQYNRTNWDGTLNNANVIP